MNAREHKVAVSFGHLSVLEWGDPNGPPVLALHGWQDNALSFLPLARLLPHLHIVAFDFSGHGSSSHLGPGANYNAFHFICDVLQVANWLKWDTFSILAHSMGALVAIKFVTIFPSRVVNLITLDVLYPSAYNTFFTNFRVKDFVELYLKLDSRQAEGVEQKVSYENAVQMMSDMRTNLSREHIDLLLTRSVKIVDEEYVFMRDHRLKLGLNLEYTKTSIAETLDRMHEYRGTWLAILNKNPWYTPLVKKIGEEKIEEKHTRNCEWFKITYLEHVKTHYFHMENAQLVAPHVAQVFEKL